MRILFVCMQYIHASRWINQLKESEHEIYVFDCLDKPIHKDLLWTNYTTGWSKRKIPYINGEHFLEKKIPFVYEKIKTILKVTASEKLIEIIKEIQPDLVHSLEMQSESYPVLEARKQIEFNWAYFSWGSDIYLYQNNKEHLKKIKNVFSKLEYLFVDNSRDIKLAENLGFQKETIGVYPGGGGYNINTMQKYYTPPSKRKLLLIKGYQHWAGRALFVLEALEKLIEDIREFDVFVYSAHDVVIEKIKNLNNNYNLNFQYSSRYNQISHDELLQKFGEAKISIGNNISDGIPNTLLESIILGAFPIQSNPGGATEDYITHGENGFLINNPEDSEEIAMLISKALNSEELLKSSIQINREISKNLEYKIVKEKVLKTYAKIESEI